MLWIEAVRAVQFAALRRKGPVARYCHEIVTAL
jgi:hypothetical protein